MPSNLKTVKLENVKKNRSVKHDNSRIVAILIKYLSLTRKLSFKSVPLVSTGDIYVLTVNALMRTHVQFDTRYP